MTRTNPAEAGPEERGSSRHNTPTHRQEGALTETRTALLAAEIGEGLLLNLDPDQSYAVAMYLLARIEVDR